MKAAMRRDSPAAVQIAMFAQGREVLEGGFSGLGATTAAIS